MVLDLKIKNIFLCFILMSIVCFNLELHCSKSFAYPQSAASRGGAFLKPIQYQYQHLLPKIPVSNQNIDWRVICILLILLGCVISFNFYRHDIYHWYRKKYLDIKKSDQYYVLSRF